MIFRTATEYAEHNTFENYNFFSDKEQDEISDLKEK